MCSLNSSVGEPSSADSWTNIIKVYHASYVGDASERYQKQYNLVSDPDSQKTEETPHSESRSDLDCDCHSDHDCPHSEESGRSAEKLVQVQLVELIDPSANKSEDLSLTAQTAPPASPAPVVTVHTVPSGVVPSKTSRLSSSSSRSWSGSSYAGYVGSPVPGPMVGPMVGPMAAMATSYAYASPLHQGGSPGFPLPPWMKTRGSAKHRHAAAENQWEATLRECYGM